ncbi:putative sugar phosphate/phosphate translocator [Tetrabaena socialis]|uniref:Putative sugar phosphate/phosphate translocator n=1 Tax=Tetrabaena socialis TaxID=47790 RepID=A0A2J8AIQ4_9CHLO|nr:putative sugar phosphate/phosphate translocator [Tetrabaena socialis]|eukprot:PNH12388.1 putative sugar phosphate/phosphate translocator [Tetrabaena socialis]
MAPISEVILNHWIGKSALIASYLGLNISLNILNKWTISLFGFRFPIALSIAHMAFSFVALAPFMLTKHNRELHSPTLSKQWPGLLFVGICFAVNVGLNNVSLLSISLSLNQVIRASIPVFTSIGSVLIERRPPSRQEFLSLLVLVGGVSIAVWEGSNSKASFWGVVFCLVGTMCNGLMMSSIGKLLTEKLDVLRLTFYTAPLTLCVLVPFFNKLEAASFKTYSLEGSAYMGVILLGCLNALAYNLIHSLVIKVTSSVTTTVIGEMKIVLLLLLSAIVLGESDVWTTKMMIGCTTAVLGFCMYSHAKMTAPQAVPVIIKGVPELSPGLTDSLRSPLMPSTQAKQLRS